MLKKKLPYWKMRSEAWICFPKLKAVFRQKAISLTWTRQMAPQESSTYPYLSECLLNFFLTGLYTLIHSSVLCKAVWFPSHSGDVGEWKRGNADGCHQTSDSKHFYQGSFEHVKQGRKLDGRLFLSYLPQLLKCFLLSFGWWGEGGVLLRAVHFFIPALLEKGMPSLSTEPANSALLTPVNSVGLPLMEKIKGLWWAVPELPVLPLINSSTPLHGKNCLTSNKSSSI